MSSSIGLAVLNHFVKIYHLKSKEKEYLKILTQKDADRKRGRCGQKSTLTPDKKRLIENHLRLTWSPEIVAYKLKLATPTVYNWLNNGRLNFLLSNLPHRNVYQRRKKATRGTFKVEQTIEQRPAKVK